MTHKDQEFNKYCADVMGFEYHLPSSLAHDFEESCSFFYNPHDDLNQMAEVVEELESRENSIVKFLKNDLIYKTAFRKYIISTMENSNER